MKKLTQEEFISRVYNLVGDEYIIIGEYVNSGTPILIKHNIDNCKHEYKVYPHSFFRGSRCQKCANKLQGKKLIERHNMFVEKLYNIFGDEITVLGKYTGYNKKILIKHEKCQYEYEATPEKILQGKKCPKCAGRVKWFNK